MDSPSSRTRQDLPTGEIPPWIINALLAAYSAARRSGLLDVAFFEQVFLRSYFSFKHRLEDTHLSLIRSFPAVFKNGDILDIGASVGYTASILAETVDRGCLVHAFEPDPWNFRLLEKVIRQSGLSDRIRAVRSAVGERDGNLPFWYNERHLGDHRVATPDFLRDRPDRAPLSMVPVTSVDRYLESLAAEGPRRVSFVKIDVQGYELPVCQGMERTLSANPELVISLEYAPGIISSLGYEPERLLEFLLERGFRLYLLRKGRIETDALGEIREAVRVRGYVDLLGSRRGLG